MAEGKKAPVDYTAWARRVNDAWLVRGDLDSDAAVYMDYLSGADPERLVRSCERAWKLLSSRGRFDDPKPWFYGGLFSLATEEEAERFLSGHPFISAVVPCFDEDCQPSELADAGPNTREKINSIRERSKRINKIPR
jgi:hypothetical protein